MQISLKKETENKQHTPQETAEYVDIGSIF